MPCDYFRIHAGAQDEPGIDGGIGAIADTGAAGGRPPTQVTTPVPSLDDCIARVEVAGGRLVEPKMPTPGIGWLAACAAPAFLPSYCRCDRIRLGPRPVFLRARLGSHRFDKYARDHTARA